MSARAYLVAKAERDLAASARLPKVKVSVERDGKSDDNDAKVALIAAGGTLVGGKLVGAAANEAAGAAVRRFRPRLIRLVRRPR